MKTCLNDSHQISLDYLYLIYELIRSFPANLMKLSLVFMEIRPFETIHCLNFNVQRQKRHDVTYDVNINFLISVGVRCMENMKCLANLLADYS